MAVRMYLLLVRGINYHLLNNNMNSFDYNLISENNIKHVIKFNDLTLDEKFLYFITKIEITGHDNNFMICMIKHTYYEKINFINFFFNIGSLYPPNEI
jgi:hypothetical protein